MGETPLEIPRMAVEKRLDSWKEIAAYLNRDVTTVQRWERREAMPVHRHQHKKRGSVYALSRELDAWVASRRLSEDGAVRPDGPRLMPAAEAPPQTPELRRPGAARKRGLALWLVFGGAVCLCLVAVAWFLVRSRAAKMEPIRSIAVLPFRNLSGDASQEYLADGITEALIGRLSGIHELRVVSHTSVMRFRNPQQSVPEIARSLGVDAVVEGSVIREGSRIRVTAQLIRGATDGHLWSNDYDGEMRDVLTLESQVAQLLAEKVKVSVTGEERQRLAAARPVAPEVYESFLKGMYALNHANSRVQMEQGIGYFQDAVQRDSTFAPGYLGLAWGYSLLGSVFVGEQPTETRPKVMGYVRQALAHDPNLVEAHVVLANALQTEWQWSDAESEYKRALELNPNDANANAGYASWLACQGRTDEAVTRVLQARALDPFSVSGDNVSWILFMAHRYDEAIRASRGEVAVNPENAAALWGLGFPLLANNQAADAIPVLEKSETLTKGSAAVMGVLIRAYAHAGRRNDALRLLAQLKQRQREGYVPAAAFVNAYLGLGENEEVFPWLEQAYREKSNILQFIKAHPYFDPIRSDPRFANLLHRVGLG